jgi:dTDP-4-dehydrorhamnose reductase
MRILLTGSHGQVGTELMRLLPRIADVTGTDRRGLDLEDSDALRSCIRTLQPQLIVNAAAYTNVDRAEEERGKAFYLNAKVPAILAEEGCKIGAFVLHYSTDYVFDGEKKTPYTENDIPRPLNVYGETKLAGEAAIVDSGVLHFILRTSWIYSAQGANFVRTILRAALSGKELRVVSDQLGAPTCSRSIAQMTATIIDSCLNAGQLDRNRLASLAGVYHLTAAGATSWYGFACAILEDYVEVAKRRHCATLRTRHVIKIASKDYPSKAKRPRNSRLSNAKFERAFGLAIPHWRLQLPTVIEEIAVI